MRWQIIWCGCKCNTSILTSKSSAMKTLLPFLTLVIFFASCTSVYKSGQTPDDVYYSPERPQDDYVRAYRNNEPKRYSEEAPEDQYLRLKVRNRSRWSSIDYNDYYTYRYDPYCHCECAHTYTSWNYFYNPYYNAPAYVLYSYYPKATVYNKPRVFNLNRNPQQETIYNPKLNSQTYRVNQPSYSSPSSTNDNYRNSGTNAGQYLRDVFGKSSSGSSTNPSSTTPSSSNSSSGSSSSGSSAPVRKF